MMSGLVSLLDIQWRQAAYRRFVRALERGALVIRTDKRGTGLSDPTSDLPTTKERVQDPAAVLAAARSSPAVLFGMFSTKHRQLGCMPMPAVLRD